MTRNPPKLAASLFLCLPQQLRHLGDVGRDPARAHSLALGELSHLSHRRFRVSNSIQIQNSRRAQSKHMAGLRGGDTMLIADYIAISGLIVLALWAGAEWFC